jgi:hypothetical protein
MTAPSPRDFPDRVLRDALVRPANLRALLRRTHPGLADRLDYPRMEVVGRSYLLDDWRRREADVLVRLPLLGSETEVLVCVLVEHQTNPDPVMPLRLLLAAVLYWEQEWQAWQQRHEYGVPLRLTPIVPVVLLTGPQPWNTNRTLADLFAGPDELKAYAPQWPMPLSELILTPPGDLLASGEPFWQALAVVRAEREEPAVFRSVFVEALERLAGLAETDRVEWERLLKMMLGWGMIRRSGREQAGLIEAVRQSHLSALRQEEVTQMIENLGQTWEQELRQSWEQEWLGRAAQARTEGRTEGRAEGELLMCRQVVDTLLRQRFGELPADVVQRVAQADLPALQRVIAGYPTLTALKDLPL